MCRSLRNRIKGGFAVLPKSQERPLLRRHLTKRATSPGVILAARLPQPSPLSLSSPNCTQRNSPVRSRRVLASLGPRSYVIGSPILPLALLSPTFDRDFADAAIISIGLLPPRHHASLYHFRV